MTAMKGRILITGASGFVGSHLVDNAVSRGLEVYAGVRSTSSKKYLQHEGLKFFELDFSKKDQLLEDLKAFAQKEGGFDYVIQNAGVTRPRKIEEFHKGNVEYSEWLAKCCVETQPALKKFVFMSSMGAIGPLQSFEDPPLNETSPYRPLTPYGKSKAEAEQRLKSMANLPYVILRPTGVFGPRDKNFGKILRSISKGIDMRIASDRQRLTFIYVKDLARVAIDAAVSPLTKQTYNITDGQVYSPSQFSAYIKSAMKAKAVRVRIPKPILMAISYSMWGLALIRGRSFHLSPYKMRELTAAGWDTDISAVKKDLKFKAQYDLESGINEYAEWYKEFEL